MVRLIYLIALFYLGYRLISWLTSRFQVAEDEDRVIDVEVVVEKSPDKNEPGEI